jgi:hypothetical protein
MSPAYVVVALLGVLVALLGALGPVYWLIPVGLAVTLLSIFAFIRHRGGTTVDS